MKSWVLAILAILLTPMIFAVPSQATGPEVSIQFFDMADNPLTQVGDNHYSIGVGQQFQALVGFKIPYEWQSACLAFRYGTAEAQGGADIDGHFVVTDTVVDTNTFSDSCMDLGSTGWAKEPGADSHCAFGDLIILNSLDYLSSNVLYRGVTYTMTNKMLAGDTGNISIYSYPNVYGSPYTSIDGQIVPNTIDYSFTTIPEPSSLMAMGCAGVGVLGNLLHRRRKKTAAKS